MHFNTTSNEIVGKDGHVVKVLATDRSSGEPKQVEFDTDGVFVFVGLKPNTQFLAGSGVELDELGFVKCDDHLRTNVPGIFVAGDVRSGSTMQIASATGEGAAAALYLREYLNDHARKYAG